MGSRDIQVSRGKTWMSPVGGTAFFATFRRYVAYEHCPSGPVFEAEPLPAEHPLWRLENVIVTPHVAGFSPRIAERHLAVLLDNLRRFARGEALRNVVDKARWF